MSNDREGGGMLCSGITDALTAGGQAADILEALPADEAHGYTADEEAAQFAAVDRLVAAYRRLARELAI